MKGLVEGAAQVDRLSIQEDVLVRLTLPRALRDGAQAKVGVDGVNSLSLSLWERLQPHRALIEMRVFRRPGARMGDAHLERRFGRALASIDRLLDYGEGPA